MRVFQPHLVHQVHCPTWPADFMASNDTYSCQHFVPNGFHYGWPYQMYLMSSQLSDDHPEFNWEFYRRHPLLQPKFTDKLTLNTITTLESVINHGDCLATFLRCGHVDKIAGYDKKMTQTIHPLLDLYFGKRSLNWTQVIQTFSPDFNQTLLSTHSSPLSSPTSVHHNPMRTCGAPPKSASR